MAIALRSLPIITLGYIVVLLASSSSSQAAFVQTPPPEMTSTSTSRLQQQQRRPLTYSAQPVATRSRTNGGRDWKGVGLLATSTGADDAVVVRGSDMDRECSTAPPDAPCSSSADGDSSKAPHLSAYWTMLRPQNIPSSFGLVAAGALVASHTFDALMDPKVLLTAFAAASVSVGSCVLNDWFDIELDRVNEPERPLVTGEVVPSHALGIGLGFMLAAVASASVVDPAALQATIVASVALTLVYTPLLKPIPFVKNFVVAMVIAAAIAAGGLASGAGVSATFTPSMLTFFVVAHREILMDITDVEGDREAGVRTLPVLMGREPALVFAAALLTAGVAAAVVGILEGTTGSARPAAAALSVLFMLPLYANLFLAARSSYAYDELSSAVDQALGPLALVLGLMGVVLR